MSMTVQDFMRSYFPGSSKIHGVIVQKNCGDGKLQALYSNIYGYDEQYIRPGVSQAKVWRWGIDLRLRRVWITVNEEDSDVT